MSKIILGIALFLYLLTVFLIFRYDPFGSNPVAEAASISLLIFGAFAIVFLGYLKSQSGAPAPPANGNSNPPPDPISYIMSNFSIMIFIIGVVLILTIIGVQYSNVSPTTTNGVVFVLNILLLVGVLAFIANHFKSKKKVGDNETIWSLIKNIILFVPCLLIDVIEFLKNQYNITTRTAWIILAFDIGLILGKMYLPDIYKFLFDVKAKQLVIDPVYLNELKFISSYFDLVPQDDTKSRQYNYNYAISMWIYINPQPPNTSRAYTKFTPLFNFGDKPKISYKGSTNTLKITMRQGKHEEEEIFKDKILKLQKWNNFVLNYDGGTLDVFLNGELIASKSGVVPFMRFDTMETGAINGVHGGICNVKYFENSLKKNMIQSIYNTAKNKNPPTF